MDKLYTNLKIKKGKTADVEFEAEIAPEVIESYARDVLAEIQKDMELPGFRKGQVPEELVRKQVNEVKILEEAADAALRDIYPQIVEDEDLDVVTAPRVTITKLAPGNPVAFKGTVGVLLPFDLPDYKAIGKTIAEKHSTPTVTDEEIDGTVKNIQMMRLDPEVLKKATKDAPPELPELTDDYVKTLGKFESVEDFKNKVRESIQEEKDSESRRALREAIAAALIEKVSITLPQTLIDEEVLALRERRFEELKRSNLSLEEYLKQIGKTEANLEKDERDYVERQLKTRFVLDEIARKEAFVPDPKIIEGNMNYLVAQNPDADPLRVRTYVENVLKNEMVLSLLEGKPLPGAAEPATPPVSEEK